MGIKLKEKRKERDLTIYELAEKTDLSTTYLSNLENGQRCNPSREVMDKIADALDSTVPEIFF